MEPITPQVEQTQPVKKDSQVIIAIAIVVAALMISGTIILKSFLDNSKKVAKDDTSGITAQKVNIAPITNQDHILGNPKADVLLIEYSDTECPFCKQFMSTVEQIMADFGSNGKVAWVYRHFPLYKATETTPALHSKSGKEAEATECAAELGGNDIFWAYIKKIYDITPANNNLDLAQLYTIATEVGLDKKAFTTCLDSGKYATKISDDYNAALAAGAQGTPYTVILNTKTGETIPVSGALPYITFKTIIQAELSKKN